MFSAICPYCNGVNVLMDKNIDELYKNKSTFLRCNSCNEIFIVKVTDGEHRFIREEQCK
jgi:uncharacterized protein with PIN domain